MLSLMAFQRPRRPAFVFKLKVVGVFPSPSEAKSPSIGIFPVGVAIRKPSVLHCPPRRAKQRTTTTERGPTLWWQAWEGDGVDGKRQEPLTRQGGSVVVPRSFGSRSACLRCRALCLPLHLAHSLVLVSCVELASYRFYALAELILRLLLRPIGTEAVSKHRKLFTCGRLVHVFQPTDETMKYVANPTRRGDMCG